MSVLALLVVILAASFVAAAPERGNCTVLERRPENTKIAIKSCSRCQWQCLTDKACTGTEFDGTYTSKRDLGFLADCGDGYFPASQGLCVLVADDGFYFDTQEQDCRACTHQCRWDQKCESIIFNGVAVDKEDLSTFCGSGPIPPPSPNPPTCNTVLDQLEATPQLSSLLAAVKAAGLEATLDDPELVATIFAPTNDAIAAVPAGSLDDLLAVLQLHVVPGVAAFADDLTDGQVLNTLATGKLQITLGADSVSVGVVGSTEPLSNVVVADVAACKAVVHVIDRVLLPTETAPPEPSPSPSPSPAPECSTIADLLDTVPELSSLNAAVTAAGIKDLLDDPELVATVFAPTNAAIASAPAGSLDDLLPVLQLHVVPGVAAYAADLTNGQVLTTLSTTDTLEIILGADSVSVGVVGSTEPLSNVVQADVAACSAVVHVIDRVLLPVPDLEP